MAKTVCVKVYNYTAMRHHIFLSKRLCSYAIVSLTITYNSFQNGVYTYRPIHVYMCSRTQMSRPRTCSLRSRPRSRTYSINPKVSAHVLQTYVHFIKESDQLTQQLLTQFHIKTLLQIKTRLYRLISFSLWCTDKEVKDKDMNHKTKDCKMCPEAKDISMMPTTHHWLQQIQFQNVQLCVGGLIPSNIRKMWNITILKSSCFVSNSVLQVFKQITTTMSYDAPNSDVAIRQSKLDCQSLLQSPNLYLPWQIIPFSQV